MAQNARAQLVEYLVRNAFEPVLHASADGRSAAYREKLQHVQHATRAEIERFQGYGSAHDVVVNFKRDLSSTAAKKIHAELRALDLPTINDLREAFEQKARDLGVDA